jgi:hypothetical protein
MSKAIRHKTTKSTPAPAAKKPRVAKGTAHAAPPNTKPARKATGAKKPAAGHRGSKTAKILGLLKRPGGVTLKEIMKATDWQAHSVRGFLSGTVGKKMGTPVESSKRGDGERAYRISSK